jgi:hypothetical protein
MRASRRIVISGACAARQKIVEHFADAHRLGSTRWKVWPSGRACARCGPSRRHEVHRHDVDAAALDAELGIHCGSAWRSFLISVNR